MRSPIRASTCGWPTRSRGRPGSALHHTGVARLRDGATVGRARRDQRADRGSAASVSGRPARAGEWAGRRAVFDGDPTEGRDRRRHRECAVDSAGLGGSGAAGRVRERRQPVPGALGGETARGGRAPGARRGRAGIARYFFTESVLLSVAGGVAGVALAWGAVRLLVAFGPANLPRLHEVRLDGVALAFTLRAEPARGAGIRRDSAPARRPLAASLHENGRGSTSSRGRHRARQLLMGGQVALALVLARGVGPHGAQLPEAARGGSRLRCHVGAHLQHRLAGTRLPGSARGRRCTSRDSRPAVGAARRDGACRPRRACRSRAVLRQYAARGGPNLSDQARVPPIALFRAVAGGYFEAMGMRLLRGRGIDRADVERSEPIVVVNKALARRYFPNQDPIGRRVGSNRPPARPAAPISVADDRRRGREYADDALAEPAPLPQLFMPMSIAGGPDIPSVRAVGPDIAAMSYVVRSATPPLGSAAVGAPRDRRRRPEPGARAGAHAAGHRSTVPRRRWRSRWSCSRSPPASR